MFKLLNISKSFLEGTCLVLKKINFQNIFRKVHFWEDKNRTIFAYTFAETEICFRYVYVSLILYYCLTQYDT